MNHFPPGASSSGPLGRIAAFIVTAALVILALMFSAVLLAILLAAGAIAGAYFWWKTRDLRKQMREFPPGGVVIEAESVEEEVSRGRVIEGEAVRVDDLRDSDKS